MLLVFVRAVFVLVTAGVAIQAARTVSEHRLANPYLVFIGVMLAAVVAVVVDLLTPRKRIQTISAIYIGLIVGVFLSTSCENVFQPTSSFTWTRGFTR